MPVTSAVLRLMGDESRVSKELVTKVIAHRIINEIFRCAADDKEVYRCSVDTVRLLLIIEKILKMFPDMKISFSKINLTELFLNKTEEDSEFYILLHSIETVLKYIGE